MDKKSDVKIKVCIGLDNSENCLYLDAKLNMVFLAKTCREDVKKGGGCPVGNIVQCPFKWKSYTDKHKGERPIWCEDVRVEDWMELFEILDRETSEVH